MKFNETARAYIFLLIFLMCFSSCQKVAKPSIPAINQNASTEERKQQYQEYKLSMKGDTFWTGFHVFQGTNEVVLWISDLAEVKNVISNFAPEALPEFNSAYINLHVSRYTILPGALIMGWQTGVYIRNQATINDHILMAAGVALFITSAIFGGISTVQFYKSFDIYNSVLMNKLQLNNSDKVLLMIFPSFSYDAENKSFNFSTKLNF